MGRIRHVVWMETSVDRRKTRTSRRPSRLGALRDAKLPIVPDQSSPVYTGHETDNRAIRPIPSVPASMLFTYPSVTGPTVKVTVSLRSSST